MQVAYFIVLNEEKKESQKLLNTPYTWKTIYWNIQ